MGMTANALGLKTLLSCLLCCSVAIADEGEKVLPVVEQVCSSCHGIDGNSVIPTIPKLAGHHPDYLLRELKGFIAGTRKSAVMGAIAPTIPERDLKAIAAYFGRQKSTSQAVTDPSLAAVGEKMFLEGDEERGVPACAGCHEQDGSGSKRFPRLAGQHREYLINQMLSFRNDEHDYPAASYMRTITKRMTEKEIRAVAEYVSAK